MNKQNKQLEVPRQRNWVAVAAHFKTGAGSHKSKKMYSRKVKHKSRSEY